jgi:MYXO-CTERM domain-containing protein
MRTVRLRTCLLGLAVTALWPLAASSPAVAAEATCIPKAIGVPGNAKPPIWWDPAELYSTTEPTDKDPRWKGALRIAHGSGLSERVSLRALYHPSLPDGKQHLYLSWKVENDVFTNQVQKVLVGLAPDCSGGGCDPNERYVIAVDINHKAPGAGARTVAGDPSWFARYLYRFDGATTNGQDRYLQVANPAWFNRFRMWFSSDPTEKTWTINMLIPVGSSRGDGLPLTEDFFLTYSVAIGNALGVGYETWPRNQTCGGLCTLSTAMTHTPSGIAPQARAPQMPNWHRFRFGTAGDCTEGISLDVTDIGILPSGGDPKTAVLGHEIRRDAENIFVARPENNTGGTAGDKTIQAIFRMANWGSTPTGGTVIDEGDWLDLYDDRSPKPEVLNDGDILDGDKGVMQTEWHPETAREKCLYGAPDAVNCAGIDQKGPHQCVMVELKSHGGNYLFTNDSVHRNMNFVDVEAGAMSLALEAFITPRGARRIPDRRERYVYVQADLRRLPAQVDPKEYDRMIKELDARLKRWQEERGSYADLARFLPTAAIHVYHETGEFDRPIEKEVLEDQASFGLFVDPPRKEIPIGWGLAIDGAVEVAPGLYKMRISDTGTAIVRVRLKALTVKDPKFDRGDPAWRSKAHKDTRCNDLDERECAQPAGKSLSLASEIDQASEYGDTDDLDGLDGLDDAGAPGAAGCQSTPGAAGSAAGVLLLGLMLLGWYALRRRARG